MNKIKIIKNLDKKKQFFNELLDIFVIKMKQQFDFDQKEIIKELESLEKISKVSEKEKKNSEITNKLIKYNDNYRKKMNKISNLLQDKSEIYKLNQRVIEEHKKLLKKEEINLLKKKFDEICSYDSKNDNSKYYYNDPKFCSYIISKTFKKTFNDISEFFFYTFKTNELFEKPKLKICSIGGGSGNDALSLILSFLSKKKNYISKNNNSKFVNDILEKKNINLQKENSSKIENFFDVTIYDINNKSWEICNKKIIEGILKNLNFKISWEFIDHGKDYNLGNLNADFITICWTLNESIFFNEKFWEKIIKENQKSHFYFVEGEDTNMNKIFEFLEKYFNNVYYEKHASPRKIYAFNSYE